MPRSCLTKLLQCSNKITYGAIKMNIINQQLGWSSDNQQIQFVCHPRDYIIQVFHKDIQIVDLRQVHSSCKGQELTQSLKYHFLSLSTTVMGSPKMPLFLLAADCIHSSRLVKLRKSTSSTTHIYLAFIWPQGIPSESFY